MRPLEDLMRLSQGLMRSLGKYRKKFRILKISKYFISGFVYNPYKQIKVTPPSITPQNLAFTHLSSLIKNNDDNFNKRRASHIENSLENLFY